MLVLWIVGLSAAGAPAISAELLDVETSYLRGKTLTYLVGTEAGGTYDAYARLIGRYIEEHLPDTRVRVRNVPGAGSFEQLLGLTLYPGWLYSSALTSLRIVL